MNCCRAVAHFNRAANAPTTTRLRVRATAFHDLPAAALPSLPLYSPYTFAPDMAAAIYLPFASARHYTRRLLPFLYTLVLGFSRNTTPIYSNTPDRVYAAHLYA